MKLFEQVSLEERTQVEAMPLTIEAVVAMEDADHDVTIAAEEVNTGISMMATALEIGQNIESQIAVEEAILDAGTATAGIAQLAMVNLQANASMLGMESADYVISAEAIEQNPSTALKVSVEAAKDTFKKIIDQIKAFFSKMWSKIKKLAAKVALMVTDYEKKFKGLGEKAAELNGLKEGQKPEFADAEAKKIISKFYGVLKAGKFEVARLDNSDVLTGKQADFASSIVKVIASNKVEDEIKKASTANKKELTELSKAYDGLPSGLADDNTAMLVARNDGTTFKAVAFKVEKVELKTGHMSKVVATYINGSAKKDVLSKAAKKVSVLSVADIKTVIATGEKLAKGVKDYAKSVEDMLGDVDKATGTKPEAQGSDKDKEADTAKIESAYGVMMSGVNTNALKFSSDALLGYVAVMKNLSYLASVSMSKYEAKKD